VIAVTPPGVASTVLETARPSGGRRRANGNSASEPLHKLASPGALWGDRIRWKDAQREAGAMSAKRPDCSASSNETNLIRLFASISPTMALKREHGPHFASKARTNWHALEANGLHFLRVWRRYKE